MNRAQDGRRATRRDHGASVLVAALGSAFGVLLLQGVDVLATIVSHDAVAEHGSVRVALVVVAAVFLVIALYVSAIVTANTVATVIAGRTRTIALLRLVGASASSLRRSVAREGLLVGVVGALIGGCCATALAYGSVALLAATGAIPRYDYALLDPLLVLPPAAVVVTTWLASWAGSRRVLVVSPLEATGVAQEPSRERVMRKRGRAVAALVLVVAGFALLGLGIVLGLLSPFGVLVGLVGGILSFTGLVLGAHRVMPPVLRLAGAAFGPSVAARLAAANPLRNPERSSRTAIGLVIGITLVTMFVVAADSYRHLILTAQHLRPEELAGVDQVMNVTIAVFSGLIGFSAVIAAVGMVNSLSLGVLQRSRELGLLRALGVSSSQLRVMILAESAQLVAAATGAGLVLGIFYGWAGAQSLLGSVAHGAIVAPAVPGLVVVAVVAAAAVLAAAASLAPTRRATRLSPVAALAVE